MRDGEHGKKCPSKNCNICGTGWHKRVPNYVKERLEPMKPSEVIAMRDRLAEWLTTECKDNSEVLAESLIKSGWVVAPPKNEGEGAK